MMTPKLPKFRLEALDIQTISAEQTLAIRQQVLWPDLSRDACRIENDEIGLHYGVFYQQKLLCVASIFVDEERARLRKFATLDMYQGMGIGRFLLRHILSELETQSFNEFWCDARESALSFYQYFGMQTHGERFYKGDIPYRRMTLNIQTLKL